MKKAGVPFTPNFAPDWKLTSTIASNSAGFFKHSSNFLLSSLIELAYFIRSSSLSLLWFSKILAYICQNLPCFPAHLAAIAAVSHGAAIIEKHFTLNKFQKGADHKISLEPKEFKLMVKKIRAVEKMLGHHMYKINSKVKKKRNLFLRLITARKKIKKGDKLSLDNIGFIRHAKGNLGLEPKYFFNLRNKRSKVNMNKGQVFTKRYLIKWKEYW